MSDTHAAQDPLEVIRALTPEQIRARLAALHAEARMLRLALLAAKSRHGGGAGKAVAGVG